MARDYFEQKASSYEGVSHRVQNVVDIANTVLDKITFSSEMNIMDFGSGTGLLLERVAPYVASITAVDISKSMNEQLMLKAPHLPCQLELIEMDLSKEQLDQKFDGIISSMTLHHIKDIQPMFEKFLSMLNPGGFIAIADLDTEDGSFHRDDTGVHHFGFDQSELINTAKSAGFTTVEVAPASIAHMPHGDYPIFLLTARA